MLCCLQQISLYSNGIPSENWNGGWEKGGYRLHGLDLEVALGGVVAFEDVPLDDFSQEGDGEGLAFFIVAADRNCLAAIPLHGSDAFVKLDENEIIADDGVEFSSGKKFHVGEAFR